MEPAPDPWVILGQSGLSAGLSVPGVIDTRMGRAQPLTHPLPAPASKRSLQGTDMQGVAKAYLPLPETAQQLEGGCPEGGAGPGASFEPYQPRPGHRSWFPQVPGLRDHALRSAPTQQGALCQRPSDPAAPHPPQCPPVPSKGRSGEGAIPAGPSLPCSGLCLQGVWGQDKPAYLGWQELTPSKHLLYARSNAWHCQIPMTTK